MSCPSRRIAPPGALRLSWRGALRVNLLIHMSSPMRPRRHCRAAEVGVCGTPVPSVVCARVCWYWCAVLARSAGWHLITANGVAQWRQRHMWMCVSSAVHLSCRMRGPALRARSVSAASVVGEDCTVTTFQDGKHRRQRVGRGGGKHGGALAQVEMLTDPAKIDRGRGRRSTNQAAPKSNQPRLQQVGTRPTPFGRADGGCTGRGVAAARRRHATAGALAATAALTLLSPPAAAQSTGGRRRPA